MNVSVKLNADCSITSSFGIPYGRTCSIERPNYGECIGFGNSFLSEFKNVALVIHKCRKKTDYPLTNPIPVFGMLY